MKETDYRASSGSHAQGRGTEVKMASTKNRLLISTKLYGRQAEVGLITSLFDEMQDTKSSRSICVSAESGVGKTALLNELYKHALAKSAYFVKGKFDQYDVPRPYNAFGLAFHALAKSILRESIPLRERIKASIQARIASRCSILTDLAPALITLVGKYPALPMLGPDETRNRFIDTIKEFISTISLHRSLVIFLDDLQWSDTASLELLTTLLTDCADLPILWLLSYRSEEVDQQHRLHQVIQAMGKCAVPFKTFVLKPLELGAVKEMLVETLGNNINALDEFAGNIMQATQGNPFFIHQYLQALYQGGHLYIDSATSSWSWDSRGTIELINSSVIHLIHKQFHTLSQQIQDTLKIASVLGGQFTADDIAIVTALSPASVESSLTAAHEIQLVSKQGDEYSFAHDKAQQAIFELLSKKDLYELHLNIAQRFEHQCELHFDSSMLYDIAKHWNEAKPTITQPHHIKQRAHANLRAAQKALNETAIKIANDYANQAADILHTDLAQEDPPFAHSIILMLARTQYLNGDSAHAYSNANIAMKTAASWSEKVDAFRVLKNVMLSQGADYPAALRACIELLSELSEKISTDEQQLATIISNSRAELALLREHADVLSLINHPTCSNEQVLQVMLLYVELWEVAYYAGNVQLTALAAYRLVLLSIEHGNSSLSPFGYVLYGLQLAMQSHYQEAYLFGRLAMQLVNQNNDKIMLPKVNNLFCNYIAPYHDSYRDCTPLYQQSAAIGQENGDYLFGLWGCFFSVWTRFVGGATLAQTQEAIQEASAFIHKTKDTKMIYVFHLLQNIVGIFQGKGSDEDLMKEADGTVVDYLRYWKKEKFLPAATWFCILRGQLLYVRQAYREVLTMVDQQVTVTDPSIVMWPLPLFYFYTGLSVAALKYAHEPISESHENYLCTARTYLQDWANACPQNFGYQHALLEAEIAKAAGDSQLAGTWYVSAIDAARKYNGDYAMALTQERFARFLYAGEQQNHAAETLAEAVASYRRWGAPHIAQSLFDEFSAPTQQS